MEKIVSTLKEDLRKLSEERLKVAAHDLLLLLVDEHEDDLAGTVRISPVLHLQGILDLCLAELKKEFLALRVVELDRVGDLAVDEGLRVLLCLDELLEVAVKGLSQASVLTLAIELKAKLKELGGHEVVEVEKLGVLAEGVKNDFRDGGVEVDARNQTVFVNDLLELAVGEKKELFGGSVHLLSNVGLLGVVYAFRAGLTLIENLGELLRTIRLLDLLDDSVVLLNKMIDDGLEEMHRLMLRHVPEVHQVVLQLLGCIVCDANIDQVCLKVHNLAC